MARRVELSGLGVVAVALALSACFGPTHSHVSPAVTGHFKGLPKGVRVPASRQDVRTPKPWAVWAGPQSIYVMTWDSGSCPRIPSSVRAADVDLVVISTVEHDFHNNDDACTSDLAVTTSVVRLPSDVDSTHALAVRIDGTSTQLAARTS